MSILTDEPELHAKNRPRPSRESSTPPRLGGVAWMVILVLLSLMVATDFVAYLGWTLSDGMEVSTAGYVATAMGALFSLIVGNGLIALVLYSGRSASDEPLTRPDTNPKRVIRSLGN